MKLRERVRALEQIMSPEEAYRLLFIADDADEAAEIARYRETSGYRGPVICINETDARL